MSEAIVPRRTMRGVFIAVAVSIVWFALLPMGILPTFIQVILCQSALIAWLFITSGTLAAAIAAFGLTAASYMYLGVVGVSCVAFAVILPACVAIYINERRQAFKYSLQVCLTTSLVGALLAVGLSRLMLGVDIADALAAALRNLSQYMPKEQMDTMFGMLSQIGYLTIDESTALNAGSMSVQMQSQIIAEFSEIYRATAVFDFPAEVMAGSIITGLLAVVWPRSAMRRMGYQDPAPYITLSKWRLNDNVVYGLLAAWVAAFIARVVYPASGLIIQYAINRVFMLALAIQGAAILDEQWKRGGMKRTLRGTFLILLYFILRLALALTGGFWLAFGPDGLYRRLKQKFSNREGK